MPKLTKQDIQDIANGYTIKYVSNSFTKDELIIELAQLCLQAIDEKEDILPQPAELDEEEQTMVDKIEQNIREIASRYKWTINEKNLAEDCQCKTPFLWRGSGANVLAIRRKITLMAVAQLHAVKK